MAGKTPKYFRIATEGATSDGREIDRDMLVQIAAGYDANTYGARINLEHIRGILPDGPFKAYGDVLALKAEKDDGKMRLYAQLDPTPELVALTKARQKIYCSMEISPDFADTGEAYLVGLAVTDNPASLGCEMLRFSAKSEDKPLASRKQDPDNLITEATEVALDFSAEEDAPAGGCLAESIKRLFGRQAKAEAGAAAQLADSSEAVQLLGQEVKALSENFAKLLTATEGMAGTIDQIKKDQASGQEAFATLKGELETTEAYTRRPAATGGSGAGAGKGRSESPATVETDC
ncbi:GPO family capsid scaffolding protein [Cupriavidus malaysiensis]|uniref:Capsid scaffolding protein n=1 Tax=Cupriavidus malaysiensis TaxID=367825 RepID=A0ABM6EZL7_9BURK|nr:GPO family capsid scaffolding protein [Cupriavidus malaysiensis]AOZ04558.1 capsid scaffolding protein [Cupriavidus malaysiensis]